MASREAVSTETGGPNVLLVGVYAPYNTSGNPEAYYEEFISLVTTLDVDYEHSLFFKLRSVDKSYFLTKGKLEEVVKLCEEHKIDQIIISESLTPLQERNIADLTHTTVIDRTQLILEIFRAAAQSSEGKIQVEMADIEYQKTRLAGKGIELMQQAGFTGGRGPGETMKEKIRRHYEEKWHQARKQLERLQRARDVQRKRRVAGSTPLICIVGYTNAGKSSLLNRLTKSDVLAEDKLFATLDTTTRELFVNGKKKALISDSVGFISQLPHHLIEAFKSTLDELRFADLLLHVVDISNPMWEHQIEVVNATLEELDIKKPVIYVFNKIDELTPVRRDFLATELKDDYTPHVFTSTLNKEGVEALVSLLDEYPLQRAVDPEHV